MKLRTLLVAAVFAASMWAQSASALSRSAGCCPECSKSSCAACCQTGGCCDNCGDCCSK